mmetsp:Transcript_37534/g.106009  ORF Transcript_37534/g.106009 Transcript_37534/m.106009 type:complete len:82 (+) Transcript_37534:879-1124(+)
MQLGCCKKKEMMASWPPDTAEEQLSSSRPQLLLTAKRILDVMRSDRHSRMKSCYFHEAGRGQRISVHIPLLQTLAPTCAVV